MRLSLNGPVVTPLTDLLGSGGGRGLIGSPAAGEGVGSGAGGGRLFTPHRRAGKTRGSPGAVSAMRAGGLATTLSSSAFSYQTRLGLPAP